MDSMIIQVGPKSGQLANTLKCDDVIFNIGRSFKNDLVLSDPFLAPNQLRLRKKRNDWYIDVLDNTNPVFVNGKVLRHSQVKIQSGDWVTVGRTVLRFFADEHAVQETRKLAFSNFYHLSIWQLLFPILLITLAVSGITILAEWLESYSEIDWERMLSTVLYVQFFIVVWAFIWAIVGKLLRHQNQFIIQFTGTSLVFLLASVVEIIFGPISYITNSQTLETILNWSLGFFTMAILLYFNYSIATNLRKPLRAACLMSGAILAFFYGIYYFEYDSYDRRADYMNNLQPPMFKFQSDLSLDDYLSSQEELFELVEFEDEEDEPE